METSIEPIIRKHRFVCGVLAAVFSVALLSGCSNDTAPEQPKVASDGGAGAQQAAAVNPNQQVNALLDEMYDQRVMRSPEWQTALGIKDDYDKLDDISEEHAQQTQELLLDQLNRLRGVDTENLNPTTAMSVRLYRQSLEEDIVDFKWRHHNYPVNQMFGVHSEIPSLLINQHQIGNADEARDYISRLNAVPRKLDQLIDGLKVRAEKGIIAPKFVFPHVIRDSKNIVSGAPFEAGEDSALWADFQSKVDQLEISDADKAELKTQARAALTESFAPAYRKLAGYLEELEKQSDTRDGVWKFPDGKAFYENALKRTTTTELTADEIHNIGLSEVERIHGEMRAIMEKVDFDGDLQDFFAFMQTDERFYYPQTEEGREQYLAKSVELIETMKQSLASQFATMPKAELKVKAVEAFREKSAGIAFYQSPAPDGSRPGIYYANLYRLKDMPKYKMEALSYHEGIPGHHMQLAIAQEIEGLPKFRKYGGHTAYTEGWGLYTEYLAKDMGFYTDPYSDFGRLTMELWRACRLVVDTGIHDKHWSKEKAVAYLDENTPNTHEDAVKAIERYIVMPSQATAYKIGMLKIQELRNKAEQALGDRYDVREFHDVVLLNGSLPLNILEQQVDEWIAKKQEA